MGEMRAGNSWQRSIGRIKYIRSIHILASVFLVLPLANAGQSITSGTIVVIAQTKSRVIMAADSRIGIAENGIIVQGVDDTYCKISPLSGDVVFTAAGLLGDGKRSWTAMSEAKDAIANTPHSNRISSIESDSVLARWAESMMRNFQEFSKDQLSGYADANNGHITTGVIAGAEKTGQAWIHAVMIDSSKNGSLSYQGFTLTSKDPPTAYYSLGKDEVFREFEKDKISTRAVAERATWNHIGLKGVAFDRFKARRLVELTIRYLPDKLDVGGPVDEIELDANEIRWVQVKKNCQGNIAANRAQNSGK
jgi:hypothetical protein